ncbi:MAG: saccharopine dehydrogenase NADP-binding domain-containing protein [Cyclobacteriaceae bacterium]|nr:saccharopine dehydrogenase NADP-binding domain-containing protein [Cyclobacteriaceae bacterium]UYN86568.1 MAG: saccharopine dehydrogenase NADP-binding domain-containing protein [Cyclobacteriaceae bacterium]
MEKIIVYGSYGYTGKLIVNECKKKNLSVILSGRNEEALKKQSEQSGYPCNAVDIDNHAGLVNLLQEGKVVIHCGGPFRHTAKKMMDACLKANTHYTDITGEYEVFELLAGYDATAKQAGLTVLPGTGFDVVPSDCLALYLKNKLPSATHLQLAFTMSKGGLSRGTKKSMTEGLGYGGMIRENGELVSLQLGDKVKDIDFGEFKMKTLCIPWGDISTAWRSTGIGNIEVYTGATESMIKNAKRSRYMNWLLRMKWVKTLMLKQVDKKPGGPSEEKLLTGKSYLWGKVWNENGEQAEARLESVSGYLLTAKTSVLIAEKILNGNFKTGYQTPAIAYGENLIMEIEGSKRW